MNARRGESKTGLRRFLSPQQQQEWLQGRSTPRDAAKRMESPELRFKYLPRFEKLRRMPQAK